MTKNIILGAIIGVFSGFVIGTIYDSKVTKKSKWEEKQQFQQILLGVQFQRRFHDTIH